MLKLNQALLFAVAMASAAVPAIGAELITNGNFETGTLAGWTTSVQSGSGGDLFVVQNNGGSSPLSGFAYALNSSGGNYFAMTDQTGEGAYALTQSFTVDGTSAINVSFQLFANNQSGTPYATSPDRDYTVVPNQNVEVDILRAGADPFTTNPADIVSTLYGPTTGGAGANPWIGYAVDLGVLAAGSYQFRFAETDNQGFLQAGIDNVDVSSAGASVPEPASIALLGFGLAGIARVRGQRRKAT